MYEYVFGLANVEAAGWVEEIFDANMLKPRPTFYVRSIEPIKGLASPDRPKEEVIAEIEEAYRSYDRPN